MYVFKKNLRNNDSLCFRYLRTVIPDKTRFDLLLASVDHMRYDVSVCFLTSWALRHLPEASSSDASEVFDRGEMNLYAENIPVTHAACKVLTGLLWPLGDELSYEDKSIFLEEQTWLVTLVVLNSLVKFPSPMMNTRTKTTVICALKSIIQFLEEISVGGEFHNSLKTFFSNKLLRYLHTTLTTDYCSVKYFLTLLYNPVLKTTVRW